MASSGYTSRPVVDGRHQSRSWARVAVGCAAIVLAGAATVACAGELVRVTNTPFAGGQDVVVSQSGWSARSYVLGSATVEQVLAVPLIGLVAVVGAVLLAVGGVAVMAARGWVVGAVLVCSGAALVGAAAVMTWTTASSLAANQSPPASGSTVIELGTGGLLLCGSATAAAALWVLVLALVGIQRSDPSR